jgi:hypothetical protein
MNLLGYELLKGLYSVVPFGENVVKIPQKVYKKLTTC